MPQVGVEGCAPDPTVRLDLDEYGASRPTLIEGERLGASRVDEPAVQIEAAAVIVPA
jgi:hypothetical protein